MFGGWFSVSQLGLGQDVEKHLTLGLLNASNDDSNIVSIGDIEV